VPRVESELHATLLAKARELLATDDAKTILVIHELNLPVGRPDVLVANADLRAFDLRRRAGIEPVTAPSSVGIANTLRSRGPLTQLDLIKSGKGLDRQNVSRALNGLVRKQVVQTDGEAYWTHPRWQVLAEEVVAVEAKVEGWRAAAQQARSWEWLVNGTFLAFPQAYFPKVPRSQPALQRFGLIDVDGGRISIVRRPRWRTVTTLREALVDEAMYARWLTERELLREPR
jgi:hypothetical protein